VGDLTEVGDLFAKACHSLGVTQSMGQVGSALDNAASESWNSTPEHEFLSRNRFETKDQARRAVARFIDAYNTRRRHSSEMRQKPSTVSGEAHNACPNGGSFLHAPRSRASPLRSFIVTNADVDGLLAATVLMTCIDGWADDAVRFVEYRDLAEALCQVVSLDPDKLFVADVTLDELDRSVFRSIVAAVPTVVVDHHGMDADRASEILDGGGALWVPEEGERRCSTELALRLCGHESHPVLNQLALTARADDF